MSETVKTREEAVLEWISDYCDAVFLNYYPAREDAVSVFPQPGGESAVTYIDGSRVARYDYYIYVTAPVSDTTDDVNVQSAEYLEEWRSFIDNSELDGNYPDFGGTIRCFEVKNLSESALLAEVLPGGSLAKFRLPVQFAVVCY